jgi:hypothetical protein
MKAFIKGIFMKNIIQMINKSRLLFLPVVLGAGLSLSASGQTPPNFQALGIAYTAYGMNVLAGGKKVVCSTSGVGSEIFTAAGSGTGTVYRCGRLHQDGNKIRGCTGANYGMSSDGVYVQCPSSVAGNLCGGTSEDYCQFTNAALPPPNNITKKTVSCSDAYSLIPQAGTDNCVKFTPGTTSLVN